ncbi:probable RNA polymerase II nuclear localization protein SLC7A6OS [Stegostoma tigrinum]|uniref:probable RNA polymerase II nuclear localization protein SLC7A6OS n=1 Tax=Stegostoma tigrinum TaxID=3053191 RepID=UPI00202B6D45|nr:probable RNA polymerase II nuclear localization protein SLC7A6OS [Stegostoma tigrinum]
MAAAVLRVKRKRGAEPAEAFLLACKRLRAADEAGEPGSGQHVVRTLFKLAATVGTPDDPVSRHVKEALSKDKALLALKPSETSVRRIQLCARASCKATSEKNRYKVIASYRRTFSTEFSESQSDDVKCIHQPETETSGDRCGENQDSWKETSFRCNKGNVEAAAEIQVLDVVQQNEHLEKDERDSEHKAFKDPDLEQDDTEIVLCNSVKMIREKLAVSDSGPGTRHRENMEEYVYDIYYTDSCITGDEIQDILSVIPCYEENELVVDELIADEAYEDEDDENEENNWRNDYPDEDSSESYWNSEEDSEEEDESYRQCFKDND